MMEATTPATRSFRLSNAGRNFFTDVTPLGPPPGLEKLEKLDRSARRDASPMKIDLSSLSCSSQGLAALQTDMYAGAAPQKAHHLSSWVVPHAPRVQASAYGSAQVLSTSPSPPHAFLKTVGAALSPQELDPRILPTSCKQPGAAVHQAGRAQGSHQGRNRTSAQDLEVQIAKEIMAKAIRDDDSNGFQQLQSSLSERPSEMGAAILQAVLPHARVLATHRLGHALIQQLLELENLNAAQAFVHEVAGDVQRLSLDIYGCRVVQGLFRKVGREEQLELINGLRDHALHCMKSMHANHVLQVCVEELAGEDIDFISQAILNWGSDKAASHVYGCRVVMRLLEHGQKSQVEEIVKQILCHIPKLVRCRYGNYVVQHILEHCSIAKRREVFRVLLDAGLAEAAQQKYAHNVVEKCIQVSGSCPDFSQEQATLEKELLVPDLPEELATERFGASVVRCMIRYSSPAVRSELVTRLRAVEHLLAKCEHAGPVFTTLKENGAAQA